MDGLMLSTDRETGKVKKKMALESFQKVVDINLTGVFLTVRECTERMVNNNCKGACLFYFIHRFPWNGGPNQLFFHQGGHVGDAQSHYGRIFPAGSGR